MTLRSSDEIVVRTSTDLIDVWAELMGPHGFATRTLWHIFLGPDGRLGPTIVPVEDLPARPDDATLHRIAGTLHELRREAGLASIAVLYSRPGPDVMTAADRAWARAVRAAFGTDGFPWPVHLATHGRVRTFAPDDLLAV